MSKHRTVVVVLWLVLTFAALASMVKGLMEGHPERLSDLLLAFGFLNFAGVEWDGRGLTK